MLSRLGVTRNVVCGHYALVTPDGHVPSVLPGWQNCTAYIILSEAIGAKVTQVLVDMEIGGSGRGKGGDNEMFFFVVSGQATINGAALEAGGFAFVPAGQAYEATALAKTRLLIFRKRYESLEGFAAPAFLSGRESDVAEAPFLGDPHARLKTLLPDSPGADMAVNIFTYDPGATLPFVETHIMEHGLLFLGGGGIYRLGDDWMPVTAGDCLWIAPYCPQWFIAARPEPARYIYYKDVNRMP